MQQIKDLERINLAELEAGTPLTSSWHAQYRASNYVYVGGLAYTLTEGDVECMMSQFGTVVDLNLARNEDTGDSKGFAFVAYADWRSTVLAVDNFNGTELLRRRIRVDHVLDYKKPDGDSESWWELKQKHLQALDDKAAHKAAKKARKKEHKKAHKEARKRAREDAPGGVMLRGRDERLVKLEDGSFAIGKE